MKVIFDDYMLRYDDLCSWSCICPTCKERYKIPERYLAEDGCEEICGVEGCENVANDYIDFPDGSTGIIDGNLEFTYEERNEY